MAYIQSFVKAPEESMKAFNKRLRDACEEAPITSFEAAVTDGEPAIMLLSEVLEADADMVKEMTEEGESVKVGDPVPENDPIIVQVVRIGAFGTGKESGPALAESHTDTINKRAKGEVLEVDYIAGPAYDWIVDRNDLDATGASITGKQPRYIPVQREMTFAVIAYLADLGEVEAEPAKA